MSKLQYMNSPRKKNFMKSKAITRLELRNAY